MNTGRFSRKLHRMLVPIAAAPLALTALTGALYGTVLSFNMDAPWLLRLHTGHFGILNLQPIYSPFIGILTLVLVLSGISLMFKTPSARMPTRP